MQLMIEVLPAPLGPMIENSSPSLTRKLTSESARTPPKRSDTPRTSKACSKHSLRNAYQPDQAGSLQRVNRFVRPALDWVHLPAAALASMRSRGLRTNRLWY